MGGAGEVDASGLLRLLHTRQRVPTCVGPGYAGGGPAWSRNEAGRVAKLMTSLPHENPTLVGVCFIAVQDDEFLLLYPPIDPKDAFVWSRTVPSLVVRTISTDVSVPLQSKPNMAALWVRAGAESSCA
jgi:hypothetical protein